MFNNIGWAELAVLAVLGMLIFGPERLPEVASKAARMVREFRKMASGAKASLREEMGTDFDELRALSPRRMMTDMVTDGPSRPRTPAANTAPAVPAPHDGDAT